ncbi:MAG: hypothetical protein H8E27_10575 [Verrucomicrobia subdivision 3 bacterium]|nr:hypothetical protein [Limisphaerales bacterium]
MTRTQIIIIAVAVVVVGVTLFTRPKDNEFADRDVALDSDEAKAALAIIEKLAESTNYLAANLSAEAPPMARQQLLQLSQKLTQAANVKLKRVSWRGEYLSVAVTCSPATEHWFYLAEDDDGQLKLLGVQQ